MGDYVDGQAPSPGRPMANQSGQNLDVSELAKAIAKEIGGTGPRRMYTEGGEVYDGFDDTKSLDQLAKAMTVERGNNQSNFDNLGNVKKTERDSKETQDKIDLLKGLD